MDQIAAAEVDQLQTGADSGFGGNMARVLPIDSVLSRGVVLRARLDRSHLDDPSLLTREKFLIILNCRCPEDPIYVVLATSNLARFDRLPHLKRETVALDPASYDFLSVPTVLDFTEVKRFGLEELRGLLEQGRLSVVGRLLNEDLAHCASTI